MTTPRAQCCFALRPSDFGLLSAFGFRAPMTPTITITIDGRSISIPPDTCRKESKESMFFLRMVAAAEKRLAAEARIIWREAKELDL